MSSARRSGGEIHILAMLDGKAAGTPARRRLALPAAFWYGAAGVTICILLATLAWLVRTPAPLSGRDVDGGAPTPSATPAATATAAAAAAAAAPAPAPRSPLPATAPAPDDDATDGATLVVTTASDLADAGPATIVDLPAPADVFAPGPAAGRRAPPAPSTGASHAMPHAATIYASPAYSAAAGAAAPGHPMTRQPAPARTASTRGLAKPSAKPSPKPPAATPSTAPSTTPPSTSPLPPAPTPRTAPPPHPRRQPGAGKPAAAPVVDSDVALISAIIQHTSAHDRAAAGGANGACQARDCARVPNRQ